MLRARIAMRDGRPVHRIARDVTADVKLIDVRGWTWADLHAALLREYRKPFDLEREPLLRFRLFQRGDRRFVALQVVHRIIADAASTAMFLDELLAVYDALRRGVDPALPSLPARYLDFVNWQNRLLASPETQRMLRYWIEHLPAELPALPLPTDRPRPDVQTHHGASQCFVLGSDLTARIQAMAQVTGATPSAILLAAYCLLLHRYTGRDDIIVGNPVAGRMQDVHAATYGSFANALPLHVSLAGDPAFLAVLDRVRATVAGALDHQDYPFARLVEELGLPHDPGRSPVFQVMFELLDRATTERRGIKLDHIELPEQAGPLDLTLSVREDEPEHALRCTLTYNRDLFDAETIRRMASHYTRLVVAAIADPLRPVSELEMLGSAERARIVQRWSGVDVAVVPDRPVHAMIRRHAALRPDSLAVIAPSGDGARIVTYGELDAAAAQLARRLRELGAGDGDVVAVCLDRSPEFAISLLGILHTGAAYLAVDPEDSDAHIAAQIERVGARFLVGAIAGRLTGLVGCTRLSFEDALGDPGEPAGPDPVPVAGAAGLDRTACVFQASGSPGQPRVIAISHRSLASAYHAWDVTYRLRSEARVHLQTARTALVRFTGALVRALCSGGALCLVGEPLVCDLARLCDTLVHHAVDTAELTPALARDLTVHCLCEGKRLEFLRLVVVGPGAWTVDDDRQLRALLGRQSRLIHVYGAAEATIDSAYFEGPVDGFPPGRQVPIGGPFPGSRVFVLDRHGAPVPVGVPGELWLGGNGVAAGYLGEPDATATRFKTVELDERGLMRLYRTGDLARWDARGMLHAVATAAPDAGAAIPPPARKG
jgi:hybrid polyketide synthase/nonribosomal peptide synthetase FtdB